MREVVWGIMDVRSFRIASNRSAVDVGHLRKGLRPFDVQKPRFVGGLRRGTKSVPLKKPQMRS